MSKLWKLYGIEKAELKKEFKFCPKCGKGFVMAKHNNRYYCGKCYYTEKL